MNMKSQIFKNGVISVCVPSGWKLFRGIDSGGKETSEKAHIYKNIELKTDVFRKVGITICYYGEDKIYLQARDFYDNVKDLEPFEMGRYMKNGEHEISLNDADVKNILESLTQTN